MKNSSKQLKIIYRYLKEGFERFTVSQVGIIIRDGRCLILKDHKTAKWLLPGGRADKGEDGKTAFKREMKEELGFSKFEIIGLADYDIWHTPKGIPVCAIASLMKNDTDEVKLSFEHTEFKWVAMNDLDKYEFRWPCTRRMIEKGFKLKEILENNEK